MSKVLINIGSVNPTTELAIKTLKRILESCGAKVRCKLISEASSKDLSWCDILIDVRPENGFNKFSKALKKTNRLYIIFIDDDLLGLHGRYPLRDYGLSNCLKRADIIFSSNRELLENYSSRFNISRTVLFDTPIKWEEIIKPVMPDNILKFVFAAGMNHELPFEKYVEPALNEIVRKYGKILSLTFVGVSPAVSDYLKENIEVRYVRGMPLEEYNSYMRANRFNVGFAPLEDNEFNNRKYYNKFFEYSKVGIMGIYSHCKPYTYAITDGCNGLLAENSVNAWYNAIEEVVTAPDKIRRVVARAQEELLDKYSVENAVDRVVSKVPELLRQDNTGDVAISECKHSVPDLISIRFSKTNGYLCFIKENGLREFIKAVKRHIKSRKRR